MATPSSADAVRFVCQACGEKLKSVEKHIGKTINCPKCDALVTVARRSRRPAAESVARPVFRCRGTRAGAVTR